MSDLTRDEYENGLVSGAAEGGLKASALALDFLTAHPAYNGYEWHFVSTVAGQIDLGPGKSLAPQLDGAGIRPKLYGTGEVPSSMLRQPAAAQAASVSHNIGARMSSGVRLDSNKIGKQAESFVADIFKAKGWDLSPQVGVNKGARVIDFVASKDSFFLGRTIKDVEVKARKEMVELSKTIARQVVQDTIRVAEMTKLAELRSTAVALRVVGEVGGRFLQAVNVVQTGKNVYDNLTDGNILGAVVAATEGVGTAVGGAIGAATGASWGGVGLSDNLTVGDSQAGANQIQH